MKNQFHSITILNASIDKIFVFWSTENNNNSAKRWIKWVWPAKRSYIQFGLWYLLTHYYFKWFKLAPLNSKILLKKWSMHQSWPKKKKTEIWNICINKTVENKTGISIYEIRIEIDINWFFWEKKIVINVDRKLFGKFTY